MWSKALIDSRGQTKEKYMRGAGLIYLCRDNSGAEQAGQSNGVGTKGTLDEAMLLYLGKQ